MHAAWVASLSRVVALHPPPFQQQPADPPDSGLVLLCRAEAIGQVERACQEQLDILHAAKQGLLSEKVRGLHNMDYSPKRWP